jgi:hypothetical protein
MGAINKHTARFHGGLVVAGVSLFISAMLILALRRRTVPEGRGVATTQASPAVLPIIDIEY